MDELFSSALERYIELEREMFRLRELGGGVDSDAEDAVMDQIEDVWWHRLTQTERDWIDHQQRNLEKGITVIHHLAQLNIGRILEPLDTPRMKDFVDNLDRINALAEATPGFVWRLVGDGTNDATSLRPFPDDTLLVNMSVWDGFDHLREYVYKTAHVEFVRRRKEFFELMDQPIYVLWWVPAGHIPSVFEAKERLDHLVAHGPTQTAFTFHTTFPEPDLETARP